MRCDRYVDIGALIRFSGINASDGSSYDHLYCERCFKGHDARKEMYRADVVTKGDQIVKNRHGRTGRTGSGINISP